MKKILTFLILLGAILISCNSDQGIKLEVLSLNIRYDNPADASNDWPSRKDFVLSFLKDESPDIFGFQEVLWHQYNFLDSALDSYESIGVGRDDGKSKGEMTPVFYRGDRFRAIDSGTFWLSETPDVPGSKGWGAVLPRIVTWARLEESHSKSSFYFFNTHYSHMSDSARLMSSHIILEEVKKIAGDSPFVITGDFNMLPGSKAYATLTGGGHEGVLIIDAYLISETEIAGLDYTYNGFSDDKGEGRIDYIFVDSRAEVLNYQIPEVKQGELFLSDHSPVKATVILTSCNTQKVGKKK
ncbi:MAG: endonuclease/exonuclease/phosphatase family protein [Bacteroidota bacterium]|nr:endonuclease/exonuclease/phosphatase family protein [Bacteroidota bacterium]